MADKPIGYLTPATAFTQSDLLVMEQNGKAKSVTGQVLMRDLAKMLDGHGGIKDIQKVGTAGLEDNYQITLSDGTKFEYYITNGRDGIDGKDGAVGERGPSGTPRNWLDNSEFHFAVNQRGSSWYEYAHGDIYGVDRWMLMNATSCMEVTSAGAVTCRGTIAQDLSSEAKTKLNARTVTAAVEDAYGLIYIASGNFTEGFQHDYGDVRIMLSEGVFSVEIKIGAMYHPRMVLYEGQYTAETLPDYQYKGYAAELQECRRYYIDPYAVDVDVKWIPENTDAGCRASVEGDKMHFALDIPKPSASVEPLVLYANEANTYPDLYLNNSAYGDEALAAIRSDRKILVRTPNASGDDYVASYSPIYFYQLPNRDNNYLYLFYLRDEKQDLSALLGQPAGTVVMPVYGQLKMLLSKTYNESPLEQTAQGE